MITARPWMIEPAQPVVLQCQAKSKEIRLILNNSCVRCGKPSQISCPFDDRDKDGYWPFQDWIGSMQIDKWITRSTDSAATVSVTYGKSGVSEGVGFNIPINTHRSCRR